MKQILTIVIFITILLSACGNSEDTSTATPAFSIQDTTPTPNLCFEPALSDEVAKVNKLMREFDDYATLASNTPQAQLVVVIPDLQRVLREAEELSVPPCVEKLKTLQIQHMRTVVQTLLAFMGNTVNTEHVNANIAKARELHLQYDLELAKLLGITLQVAASPNPTTDSVSSTTTSPVILTNPGPNEINLWNAPSFNAPVIAVLAIQASVIAIGRTADNQWIQVEIPNQPGVTAWVIASVAQLSVPLEQLPVVNP